MFRVNRDALPDNFWKNFFCKKEYVDGVGLYVCYHNGSEVGKFETQREAEDGYARFLLGKV